MHFSKILWKGRMKTFLTIDLCYILSAFNFFMFWLLRD